MTERSGTAHKIPGSQSAGSAATGSVAEPGACTCDPQAFETGPEGQRRFFEDRYCPIHGEDAPCKHTVTDLIGWRDGAPHYECRRCKTIVVYDGHAVTP